MNDQDREEWVNNHELLYRWWRSSHMGITTFVRKYRKEIDKYIDEYLKSKGCRGGIKGL